MQGHGALKECGALNNMVTCQQRNNTPLSVYLSRKFYPSCFHDGQIQEVMAKFNTSYIAAAAGSSSRAHLHIIAAERTIARGFALSSPAMSGAEPCTGSKMPGPELLIDADGSMPSDPVSMAPASERMSPKMFPVTITSKNLGCRISCIAALSTYMWDSSTSGYFSFPTRVTTCIFNVRGVRDLICSPDWSSKDLSHCVVHTLCGLIQHPCLIPLPEGCTSLLPNTGTELL